MLAHASNALQTISLTACSSACPQLRDLLIVQITHLQQETADCGSLTIAAFRSGRHRTRAYRSALQAYSIPILARLR